MTNDLEAAIARLRDKLGEMVLPPDPKGLEALCDVAPNLPNEVLALFKHVGGTQPHRPLYLMSPEKVARSILAWREDLAALGNTNYLAPFADGIEYLLLFHDGNANFLGLHLKPPLAPRGFVLDHDEPNACPKFRSLAAMIDAMCLAYDTEDVLDCNNVQTDYPRLSPDDVAIEDRMLSRQLLAQHLNDEDGVDAAFSAIQLSCPMDMELLMPLLDSENMWISARVCRLIGERKYTAGIARMVDAAVTRGGNRISAAVFALRSWNDERAKSGLHALRDGLGAEFPDYYLKYLT